MRYHDASPRGRRGGRRGWSDSDRAGQPSAAGNFSGHASLYTVDFLALRDTVVGSCRSEARNTPGPAWLRGKQCRSMWPTTESTARFDSTRLGFALQYFAGSIRPCGGEQQQFLPQSSKVVLSRAFFSRLFFRPQRRARRGGSAGGLCRGCGEQTAITKLI